MNGDPPIDQATAEDEREYFVPVGFARIGLSDCRRETAKSLDEHRDRTIDGDLLRCDIEQLARRIAIDMLESKEFTDRLMTWHKAYKPPPLNSDEFRKKVMEIARQWYYDERGKTRSDEERQPSPHWPAEDEAPDVSVE